MIKILVEIIEIITGMTDRTEIAEMMIGNTIKLTGMI